MSFILGFYELLLNRQFRSRARVRNISANFGIVMYSDFSCFFVVGLFLLCPVGIDSSYLYVFWPVCR